MGISSWNFELDFRVGFSSWTFELDFRVGFSSLTITNIDNDTDYIINYMFNYKQLCDFFVTLYSRRRFST